MRSNVGHRARITAFLLKSPVVIGRIEQPILQVGAVNEVHSSEVASRQHDPHLLYKRIVAVIKGHRVDNPGLARRIEHRFCVSRIESQRLVRDDVLSSLDRSKRDGQMKVVRRAVMDDLDIGIIK